MTPSVTVLTSTPFWRGGNGSTVRVESLLRHLLREHIRVRVIFTGALRAADHDRLHRIGLGRIGLRETGRPAPTPGMGAPLAAHDDPAARDTLADDLARCMPTAVIVEYLRHAHALDGLDPEVRERVLTVLDTHDVQHERADRFKAVGRPHQLAITREEEAEALSVFDTLLAIQPRDAATLASMAPDAEVLTIPHAAEVIAPERTPPVGPPVVGFVGSASHANADGLAWFLHEAWPAVRAAVPGISLEIAGDVDRLLVDEGFDAARMRTLDVRALGRISDLPAARDRWLAELCPLRIGGGLKIKVVEALAAGVPVVGTPIGAEGFGELGDALRVVEDGAGFATAIAALQDDATWCDSSGAARLAAERDFGVHAAYAPLADRLRAHEASITRRERLAGELLT